MRKVAFCHEYLTVYGKVDPGYTKWRGRILEQLVGAELLLCQRRGLTGAKWDCAVKQALVRMRQAAKCRQFELGSPMSAIKVLMKEFNDILAAAAE